jgi:hypothetical protein
MAATTQQLRANPDCAAIQQEADQSGCIRIAVIGALDERHGRMLLNATEQAASCGGNRVCVDLREVTGFTDDGVAAAVDCCRLASGLPRGVSFVVSAGHSRKALLAILASS